MAEKIIDVQSVALRTVSVEIKTLTVSNKQMTLAVFRQIPEEEVINQKTQTLRGNVWGRVNYCTCKDTSDDHFHVHVLWQKGTELRRARVFAHAGFAGAYADPYDKCCALLVRWTMAHLLEGKSLEEHNVPGAGWLSSVDIRVGNTNFSVCLPHEVTDYCQQSATRNPHYFNDHAKPQLEKRLARAAAEDSASGLDADCSAAAVLAAFEFVHESLRVVVTRHQAAYNLLLDAPQLFIAA